jgi:aspartyl-tRNA(Asn)/glutamyl-tRNA(Gln) amidotransferase subunit C
MDTPIDKITHDDIVEVAALSGFKLSDEELQAYREQFQEILNYFKRLSHVDTDGVEPTYQVTGLSGVMREDEIVDYGVSKEELLKNAPMQEKGQIKVKRVL